MNADEAVAMLQRFGEGIQPGRLMYGVDPSHDDWHTAVGILVGLPWADYRRTYRHADHHVDCALALGLDPPDTTGTTTEGHAEASTAIMAAIAKTAKGNTHAH